jgi:hypothetical protein
MAPAINDPISPTASNLCAVCSTDSTITCKWCENIKYCSVECQLYDAPQHHTLCSTFKDFQQRPSEKHYRAILFPADEPKPRFIWQLIDGDRGYHTPNEEDISHYLQRGTEGYYVSWSGNVSWSSNVVPLHELKHSMCIDVEQSSVPDERLPNMCFSALINPHVGNLRRGTHLGRGWKYTNLDEKDAWDEPDRELRDGFPLIALDLDTTSLGPLLARILVGTLQDTNDVT